MSPRQLEELVLKEARIRPVTNEIVRELTGLDRPQALAMLRRLVAEGQLKRFGERRRTSYIAV
jgi:hypothetical protein